MHDIPRSKLYNDDPVVFRTLHGGGLPRENIVRRARVGVLPSYTVVERNRELQARQMPMHGCTRRAREPRRNLSLWPDAPSVGGCSLLETEVVRIRQSFTVN